MLFVLFENLRSDRLGCDEESGSGFGLKKVGRVMDSDKSFAGSHSGTDESAFIRSFLKPVDHLILMIKWCCGDSNGVSLRHW